MMREGSLDIIIPDVAVPHHQACVRCPLGHLLIHLQRLASLHLKHKEVNFVNARTENRLLHQLSKKGSNLRAN